MEIQQVASRLSDAKFDLQVAISHGYMISQKREALRNILENYLDDILKALDFAANAEQKVKVLEVEIDDADDELKEKDDEIAALKAEIETLRAKAPAKKTKATAKDVE